MDKRRAGVGSLTIASISPFQPQPRARWLLLYELRRARAFHMGRDGAWVVVGGARRGLFAPLGFRPAIDRLTRYIEGADSAFAFLVAPVLPIHQPTNTPKTPDTKKKTTYPAAGASLPAFIYRPNTTDGRRGGRCIYALTKFAGTPRPNTK